MYTAIEDDSAHNGRRWKRGDLIPGIPLSILGRWYAVAIVAAILGCPLEGDTGGPKR